MYLLNTNGQMGRAAKFVFLIRVTLTESNQDQTNIFGFLDVRICTPSPSVKGLMA